MNRPPSIRFRIDFAENLNLGPGKIALLEAIDLHGSLVTAASSLGLSYRRAWLLLDSLNETFNEPVARSSVGGRNGGGSSLTRFGRLLIKQYRSLENEIGDIGRRHLREILPHVVRIPTASASVRRRSLTKTIRSDKKSRPARP